MKRIIALILVILATVMMLCGCSDASYTWGTSSQGFEFAQSLNAKIKTDTTYHPKDDVVLDLYLCAYQYGYDTLRPDSLKSIYRMAIYISNSETPPFRIGDPYNLNSLDQVGEAKLVRLISYDEVYYTDFGFYKGKFLSIDYDHKEKIYIPEEFFGDDNDRVYVYVVELAVSDNGEGGLTVDLLSHTKVYFDYILIGDYVKLG